MALTGQLSTNPDDEGRRAARTEVVLGAGLRQRGAHAVTIQVMDLSTHGFRAATHLNLMTGS
ncbi:MAG TPA: pilus assembly protein PilZ, partial [Allosphingosinicella sp.]|nr:pilus assembly protein PilZ [Allosphingosinicella sp.]